ncbi:hypothetical protein [Microbacterium sp. BF1]|uniref:hypothetical protein n=1 Tax=Microbacterium sp. BF1 TaxID=2821146 RepID=UPI001C4E079A|nr:hypothetical protein [Microbacterium sp. BF1]
MVDTLFGLIPAGSRGQQWVAEELQLINWGGYDAGPHRVRFSPDATLLCGDTSIRRTWDAPALIALAVIVLWAIGAIIVAGTASS